MNICSRRLLDILTWRNRNVNAMALWPVIIYADRKIMSDAVIRNHEKIHHRQQLEMLILPYYLWYFTEYWLGRIKYRTHDKAYRNISFEKEAYAMQQHMKYLENRRFMSSLKWLGAKKINADAMPFPTDGQSN